MGQGALLSRCWGENQDVEQEAVVSAICCPSLGLSFPT